VPGLVVRMGRRLLRSVSSKAIRSFGLRLESMDSSGGGCLEPGPNGPDRVPAIVPGASGTIRGGTAPRRSMKPRGPTRRVSRCDRPHTAKAVRGRAWLRKALVDDGPVSLNGGRQIN